jgi:hypothetical protein
VGAGGALGVGVGVGDGVFAAAWKVKPTVKETTAAKLWEVLIRMPHFYMDSATSLIQKRN